MTLRIGSFATLLQVFDMPASLAFYRDVLGFEVASDVPPDDRCDWVMLKMRESELMLNTAYEADEHEVTRRMKAMRKQVTQHDVTAWADSFMAALSEQGAPHTKLVRPARRS